MNLSFTDFSLIFLHLSHPRHLSSLPGIIIEPTKLNERYLMLPCYNLHLFSVFIHVFCSLQWRFGQLGKVPKGINQYSMYDPDDPALYGLLDDMTSLPIIDVGKYTQNQ